jgi:NhaP-type Na+/H+ or K+/H+ antiporter
LAVARHLRIPGIIILLGVGVGLGPDGLGWIKPASLGPMLSVIVGMAVAIILFEGGLHLELKRLKREGKVINRLITIGSLITAVLGAAAAWHWMNWSWQLSLLFGTLVIVTGPTVVTPLLRRLRIKKNLSTILEAEGVMIDPIGAIIAVAALDFVLASSDASVWVSLGILAAKLGLGTAVGLTGGLVIGWLLKQDKIVPDELENIFTLGVVLFLFEASNALLHESGIMTVTVAGIVVGNMKIPMQRRLVDFKLQLTTMLIGILFVLLAADVRLADMQSLGTAGIATVLTIIFIARPINVLICTMGSKHTWKEIFFLSWLAPRGIVAAAVASLFAADLAAGGIDGGDSLRALVFMVILITVVLQGFTAGPIAQLLNLKRKSDDGYLIVGANMLGLMLAKHLQFEDEDIILADRNIRNCQRAEDAGFRVLFGNALEEDLLKRANIESRRGVLGVTGNEGVNLMLMRRARSIAQTTEVYVCLNAGSAINREMIQEANGHVLFAGQLEFDLWSHRLRKGAASIESYHYSGDKPFTLSLDPEVNAFGPDPDHMLPVVVKPKDDAPVPAYNGLELQKGDLVIVAIHKEGTKACEAWLGKNFMKKNLPEESSKKDSKKTTKKITKKLAKKT